jgi:Aspartyl protease
VIALVSACIDGHGPFPLVIDSGASSSQIDAKVASLLHLPSAGMPKKGTGVSCSTTIHPVKVATWSIGSVALSGQSLGSSSIPSFGLHKAPAGLLGADVLSRFGAVRLDYQNQKLILSGPEGPATAGQKVVKGPTTTPTPADLTAGYPSATPIPIGVVFADHQVLALVAVTFSTKPNVAFLVDTGASTSAVSTATASTLNLVKLKKRVPVSGVACKVSASQVKSGRWSIAGTPLVATALVTVSLPGTSGAGIAGVLGSDQLSRFGSIVIDYAGGRLLV